MNQEINQQRIEAMFRMILEMADGNFTCQIPRTGNDDTIEALSALINMLSQEMKESIFHAGFINPHFTYRYLIHSAFVLDHNFIIKGFAPPVPALLEVSPPALYRREFYSLLRADSVTVLEAVREQLLQDEDYNTTLQLTFMTSGGLEIPAYCTLSRLLYTEKILVSSVTVIMRESFADENLPRVAENDNSLSPTEIQSIQKLYDHILGHLDEPLPAARELARMFGSNEYTIKQRFKQLFNTTIYQFYNSERLKKAYLLIKDSEMPLNKVAEVSGFNSYSNFIKAFRKIYTNTPTEVRESR